MTGKVDRFFRKEITAVYFRMTGERAK